MRRLQILSLVAVLAIGCIPPTPTPPDPPAPPAVDAGVDDSSLGYDPPTVKGACSRLSKLTCEEGEEGCEKDLGKMVDDRVTPVDLECISASESKLEVRLCPGIRGEGACP